MPNNHFPKSYPPPLAFVVRGRVSPSSSWSDDLSFYGQILGLTALGAGLVKWGELFFDFPFEPSYATAMTLILAPTVFNAYKWAERSRDPSAPIEGIL